MYRKSIQNISEVSSFDSIHLESVEFLRNTFEKFRNVVNKSLEKFRSCTRKRYQEYALGPKHSKSI